MNQLLELQTGQVAFISGLLSGFSLSVAVHILRFGMRSRIAQVVFAILLVVSLLFLLSLYVDVRLTIELAGVSNLPDEAAQQLSRIRVIGTTSATVAFFLFIVGVGLLGFLGSTGLGLISCGLSLAVLCTLGWIWLQINGLSGVLNTLSGGGS